MAERGADHGRWTVAAAGHREVSRTRELMLEAVPDALVLVARDGSILDFKAASEVPIPVSRDELLGTSVRAVAPVDGIEERLGAVLETGLPQVFEYEVVVQGRPRSREARLQRVDVDEALLVVRDTTEQRRALRRGLLTERMASLGVLSAGVAHEINNPLAYLMANLEYAEGELEQIAGPDVRAAIAAARQGAERMRTISGCLRIFARAEGDGAEETAEPARAVELAMEMTAPDVSGLARVAHDDRGAPPVRIGEARLAQVLVNLLVNAAQSFDPARADRNEVRIRTGASGGRGLIEVADNGPGIPPAIRNRVFDPFFTTKPLVGRGLGLAVCEGIVRAAGGELEMESIEGLGTVFRILLPATTPFAGTEEATGRFGTLP